MSLLGLLHLQTQSHEHAGDFRRHTVILGELDSAVESP